MHGTKGSKLSNFSWGAFQWTLKQFGIENAASGDDSVPKGRYVIAANLDAACRAFSLKSNTSTSRFERTFTKSHFRDTFGAEIFEGRGGTEEDFDVLLVALARDKALVKYDGRIVRIRGSIDEGDIGEEDAAIASIKELIANLQHQTRVLGCRIKELEEEIKRALGRNNRIAAAAALRSKKLAESSLSKRYAALNQLEDVAAKIEQASDQVLLVKAMESGAHAMRILNSQVGSTDKVEDVMDQVREQMDTTDEVAAILAESTAAPIDESEIDDELALLEKEVQELAPVGENREEDEEPESAKSRLESQPSPPTEDPESQHESPSLENKIANLSI